MSLSKALRLHTEIADVERDIRRLEVMRSVYDGNNGLDQVIRHLEDRGRDLEQDLTAVIAEIEGGRLGLD